MVNTVSVTKMYGGFRTDLSYNAFPCGDFLVGDLEDIPFGLKRVSNLPQDFYAKKLKVTFCEDTILHTSVDKRNSLVDMINRLQKEMKG